MRRCYNCGGSLIYNAQGRLVCEFCDSIVIEEKSNSKEVAQIKERANQCFLNCDFAAAKALYDSVIVISPDDAEAYWMRVLCEYGVLFVEETVNGIVKRVPTCIRANNRIIFNNSDYQKAYDLFDPESRESNREIACKINEIQIGIKKRAEKQEKFDVFICYKETDKYGNQTAESRFSRELYHALDKLGYRTFFAPITLEGAAGSDYEPVIFSALNSASIMFVIAYSEEHYNSNWVENEWGRYIEMKEEKTDKIGIIVPCYNSSVPGSTPNILPKRFGQTQMLDVATNGVPGLVKFVTSKLPKANGSLSSMPSISKELSNLNDVQASNLCKRGFYLLEEGEFDEAKRKFNESIDKQPDFSKPYWGILLAEMKCRNNHELVVKGMPINEHPKFRYAQKNANVEEKQEYLMVVNAIGNKIKEIYFALNKKRYEEILATGVKKQINECCVVVKETREQFDKTIAELHSVENDIKAVVAECSTIIKPFGEAGASIEKRLRDYYFNEIKNNSNMLPERDYQRAVKKEIIPANKELDDLLAKASNIANSNESFVKYKELTYVHASTVLRINEQIEKIDEAQKRMDDLNKKIQEIADKYDKALNDLPNRYDRGSYKEAKERLGDTFNAINSSMANVPHLGASTISSVNKEEQTQDGVPSVVEKNDYSEERRKPLNEINSFKSDRDDAEIVASKLTDTNIYSVFLESVGNKKLDVIKVLREITGDGLKEAKEMAETPFSRIKSNVYRPEAESIKEKLNEVGARVKIAAV